MKTNKTLEKKLDTFCKAFDCIEYKPKLVDIIETLQKRPDIDVKTLTLDIINKVKNKESIDNIIPRKERVISEATKNARYEKALKKLNEKYGRE